MALILNQNDQGVLYGNPDGTAHWLDRWAVPDGGFDPTGQAPAPPLPPAPPEPPPPATIPPPPVAAGGPPVQSGAPDVIGFGGAARQGKPTQDQVAAGTIPTPAPSLSPLPDGAGASPSPAAPPAELETMDSFDAQAAAAKGAGEAAREASERQAQIIADTQALVDPVIDQHRRERVAQQIGIQEAQKAADQAVNERANFDLRQPKDSTASTIGKVLALAFGAVGQALSRQGGENPVIAILERKAQEHARQRAAQYQQLGDVVGARKEKIDALSQFSKDADARYQAELATFWAKADKEGERQAILAGGTAKDWAASAAAAEIRQKKADHVAAAGEAAWKKKQQEAEFALETKKVNESIAARKAQIGLGYSNLKENRRQFDEGLKLKARDLDLEAEKLMQAGKLDEAKQKLAQGKEERELAIGGGMLLTPKTADGKPVADDAGRLLNKDGSVFKAPDAVSAQALRKQVTATVTAANLLDEMVRLRNEKGWSSNLVKSDEWRALKSNMGAVILEAKNAGELGALSGPDMGLIEQILGTNDPTELRDPTAGLRQARRNMVLKTRNALKTATYTGDFDVPDQSSPRAAARDEDLEALVSRDDDEKFRGMQTGIKSLARGEKPTGQAPIGRNQELGLQGLVERVRNGDATAAEGLAKAAQSAPSPAARTAASAALNELARGNNTLAASILERQFGQNLGSAKLGKAVADVVTRP